MEKLNTVKMIILPKLISRFNAISIKIPKRFSIDIGKFILKFIWKGTGSRTVKTNLDKKIK